jgi:hemerythrin
MMTSRMLHLGVPEMDEDHARIEEMLAETGAAPDACLPARYAALRAEVAAHFEREEELMRLGRTPVYACHLAQHRRILDDMDRPRDDTALRDYVRGPLTQDIAGHVASIDQLTARFLTGEIDPALAAQLKLA